MKNKRCDICWFKIDSKGFVNHLRSCEKRFNTESEILSMYDEQKIKKPFSSSELRFEVIFTKNFYFNNNNRVE